MSFNFMKSMTNVNENAQALTHLPRICHSRFCHTDVIWSHDVIL